MAKQGDYLNYLVLNASRGHKNAFLELVGFVHKEVFQIAYLLLADKQKALDATIEIFTFTFKNLTALPDQMTYPEWIKSLIIVNSFNKFKLTSDENNKDPEELLKQSFNASEFEKFSNLEKSFHKIDDLNRIILILYSKLNYDIESISKLVPKKEVEDIKYLICDTLTQLYYLSNPDYVFEYNKEKIYDYLFNEDKANSAEDSDIGERQVFFKLFDDIKNLYSNVDVSSEITNGVTEFLMKSVDTKPVEKQKRKVIDEKLIEREDVHKVLGRTLKNLAEKDESKSNRLSIFITAVKFLSVILILTAVIIYFVVYHVPSLSWEVKNYFGAFTINSEQSGREITEDDIFQTKRFSSAVISIPEIAEINVDEETEFVLVDDSKRYPIIELNSGLFEYASKIKPGSKVDPEYQLIIITNFGKIIAEHGSSFKINVSERKVEGISGIATIVLENELRLYIGAGYEFIYSSLYDLPRRVDISPVLQNLIKDSQTFKSNAEFIISNLREQDILTLLSVFVYLDQNQKVLALAKIKEFIPFIDNNIETQILQNDKIAMEFLVESVKTLADSFLQY